MKALIATALLCCTPAAIAEPANVYGQGVDLEETTSIASILADPDAYIGKTVRVEGGVLDVCPRKGCWIEIGERGAEHPDQSRRRRDRLPD